MDSGSVLSAKLKLAVLSLTRDSAEEIANVICKFIEAHSNVVYKSGFGVASRAASSSERPTSETDENPSGQDDEMGMMDAYFSVSSGDDNSITAGTAARRKDLEKLLRINIRGGDKRTDRGGEDEEYPVMSTVSAVVLVLIAKLRVMRCPHTEILPSHLMRKWDNEFVYVLLYSVFREYPSISWNRLMCQLMDSDLNEVEPYDGSLGPVATLYAQSLELPHHIHDLMAESLAGGGRSSAGSPSLMDRISPPSPQVGLAFRGPSTLLLSDSLDGWTLLHYLAATSLPLLRLEASAPPPSGEEKERDGGGGGAGAGTNRYRLVIQQLMAHGVRIGEPDFTGRTPLHIAASTLNVDCVQALITLGASVACATYGQSSGGGQRERRTPLDELLIATSKMEWTKWCSGPQLAQAVVALSGADVKALWRISSHLPPSSAGSGTAGNDESIKGKKDSSHWGEGIVEGFERNPLSRIVRLGEPLCVKALISRSLLCPHTEWNLLLIRHLVMTGIRRSQAWGVEHLWEAYSAALDTIRPSASPSSVFSHGTTVHEWVAFWHACLAACVISRPDTIAGAENKKNVLRFLLRRPQALRHRLLCSSLMPKEQRITLASELDTRLSVSHAPFLHLAILSEDNSRGGKGGKDDGEGCAGAEMLDLLLASGSMGVSHILGTWSPLSSVDLGSSADKEVNAQLTAYWLPSLYRYSTSPRDDPIPSSSSSSSAYQRKKRAATSAVVEVVGLKAHSSITGLCDISPLSLAAFVGENTLLKTLLDFLSLQPLGAYADSGGTADVLVGDDGRQDHFDTHGDGGSYTHRLSAQLLNSMAVSPVVACTLSSNAEGLLLLKENMGAVSFARACNQPDASGVVAVAAVMQMLGRVKREVGLSRAANSHHGTLAGSQCHAAVRKHFREMQALAAGARGASSSASASVSGHSLSLSESQSLSLSSTDLELSLQHLDASFSVSLSADGQRGSSLSSSGERPPGVYHGKPFLEPEVWDPDGSSLWALTSSRAVLEVASILLDNLTVGPVMFRRPSQRSSSLENQPGAATSIASGSSGSSSGASSDESGTFITTAKVWRLRERGLRARIELINRRLYMLILSSRHGHALEPYRELSALDVAQWIEHQLRRPAALGGVNAGDSSKQNLLHSLAASLRNWQDLYGRLNAASFASSLRALRALYSPTGASSRGMDKLLQAIVLLLEPQQTSKEGSHDPRGASSQYRNKNQGVSVGRAAKATLPAIVTWKTARAVLTGPESCSRKAVNRVIGETTSKMLRYGNPFVSPLVSGSHSEGNPHVIASAHAGDKTHNNRVVPFPVWKELAPLIRALPPSFTEEHISSSGAGEEGAGREERTQRVRDRVRVDRPLDCVNVLLGWVRAVYSDGEVIWGLPYTGQHIKGLSTVEISGSAGVATAVPVGADAEHADRASGITTQDDLDPMSMLPRTRLGLLEAVSLTEGRTRLSQALAQVPSYMYDRKDDEAEDNEDEEDYYYEDLELGLLPLYTNPEGDATTPGVEGGGDAIDSRAVVWSEEEEREGRGYDLKWIQAIKEASATALLSLLLTAQGLAMGEGHGLLRISRRAEAAAAVPVLLRSLTRLVKHAHSYGIYCAPSPPAHGEQTPPTSSSSGGTTGERLCTGRELMRSYVYASTVLPPRAKVGMTYASTARTAAFAGVRAGSLLGGAAGASVVFERVAVDLLRMIIRVSSAPVPVKSDLAASAAGVEALQGPYGIRTDVSNLAPVAITAQVPAHLLLLLVAQGLYSAATQLLDACAAHQLCLVHGDGSLVVGRPSPFGLPSSSRGGGGGHAAESSSLLVEIDAFLVYGVPATATTTAWDSYDAFSFAEASPLHLAVRDNSAHALAFARRYLEVFVDAKLDVATLLPFLPDDPHSPTSGTSNATLELVLSRLGRLAAYQTTELNALYYVHDITDLGPRLHGVLTSLHGGALETALSASRLPSDPTDPATIPPEASLTNTTPISTASRFGSSRYAPHLDRSSEEASSSYSPATAAGVVDAVPPPAGRRTGSILAAPRDHELALSLHLAKALRRAVLLALLDNAAVAARYWKIGEGDTGGDGAPTHVIGGAMPKPHRPPKTPAGKSSATKPVKPPRKAPRLSSVGAMPAATASGTGQSRFVLQLEARGGALVEIPQAAGPMQGLCVVPRHMWDGLELGASVGQNGTSAAAAAAAAGERGRDGERTGAARYEHLTPDVLTHGRHEDGHGRGPLSRFYTRQRKAYVRGPVAASSTVLLPFSSNDILGGRRSRRTKAKKGRRRSAGPDSDVGISLMDGSVIPWRLFHLSLYNLLRATPLPALATGVNDTGLGLLHTIGSDNATHPALPTPSSVISSLPAFNATRRLLRTLGGKPRVLSITDTGLSPVFASLVGGGAPSGPDRFRLANILLSEATKDATAPAPGAASTGTTPLLKMPLSISQQYARHSVIAVSQKAPMLLLEQARARRILAEREYVGLQVGGLSLATVTKPMDLLVLLMRETERVWSVLRKEDLTPLLRFSRGLGDLEGEGEEASSSTSAEPIVLDSLQRARRILALLKVPFSSLEEGVNKDREEGDAGEWDTEAEDRLGPFTHILRSAAFDSVSPANVRSKVSLGAAQQLKAELLGWLETRGVIREHYPHLGHRLSQDDGRENRDPNPNPDTGAPAEGEEAMRRRHLKWAKFGKYGISLSFPALLEDCLALRQWLHLSFIDFGESQASMQHMLNPALHPAPANPDKTSSVPVSFHVTSNSSGSGTFTERLYSGANAVSSSFRDDRRARDQTEGPGSTPSSRYQAYLERSFLGFDDLSRRVSDTHSGGSSGGGEDGSPGRALGLYSRASYSLMSQLVAETRDTHTLQGAHDHNHASRPYAAYHPSAQHKATKALLSFLHKHRKHPHLVRAALRQAYMILDLARMLYLCRSLITVTQTVPEWARYHFNEEGTLGVGISGDQAHEKGTVAGSTTTRRHVQTASGINSEKATKIDNARVFAHQTAMYRAAVVHPLDVIYRRLQSFKEYESGMHELVQRANHAQRQSLQQLEEERAPPTPVVASVPPSQQQQQDGPPNSRAEALLAHARYVARDTMAATDKHLRMKLCDLLSVEDLALFLRLDETISPRYYQFKLMVWRGIKSLAALKREPLISSFIQRLDHLVVPSPPPQYAGTGTSASTSEGVRRVKTTVTSASLLALPLDQASSHADDSGLDTVRGGPQVGPDAAKAARMSRGSGLRALLAFLQSFSLRDVLSVDGAPSAAAGGDAPAADSGLYPETGGIDAILAAAIELSVFEKGDPDAEEPSGDYGGGRDASTPQQVRSKTPRAAKNKTTSHGITRTTAEGAEDGAEKEKEEHAHGGGAGGILVESLEMSMERAAGDRPVRKGVSLAGAGRSHGGRGPGAADGTSDYRYDDALNMGLSSREKRLMHGVMPTEEEVVDIEQLVDAPPVILRDLLQKIERQPESLSTGTGTAAASTPMKPQAGAGGSISTVPDGLLPVRTLAQNYTMRTALLDDLHAAYRTANVLSWLVQALAGVHTRQLFFEPLVRDWSSMAKVHNPLVVTPLAFAAPRRGLYHPLCRDIHIHTGGANNPGWGLSSTIKLLQPLVARQGTYLWALASLLSRISVGDQQDSSDRRLALGTIRGLPLRLSAYPASASLSAQLLSASTSMPAAPAAPAPGPPSDEVVSHSAAPLDMAARTQSLQSLRSLLELGCDPSSPDGMGRVALSVAAIAGRADMLAELLDYCSDRQLRALFRRGTQRDLNAPFEGSAEHRYLVWHVLMAAPAPACAIADGSSDKEDAAQHPVRQEEDSNVAARGHEDVVKMLLSRGFPVDSPPTDQDDVDTKSAPPPHPHLKTAEDTRTAPAHMVSCLQLSILKRLPRACIAISARLTGDSVSSSDLAMMDSARAEQGFPSAALVTLWPQVKLHVVAEVLQATTASAPVPRDAGEGGSRDNYADNGASLLPADVSLSSVLPPRADKCCRRHALFVAQQMGCGQDEAWSEQDLDDIPLGSASSGAEAQACRAFLFRDALLSLAATLANTYAPSPIGRSARHGECPVWRAARASIGMLMETVQSTMLTAASAAVLVSAGTGGKSPYTQGRGGSHGIDRMTPGKRLKEDKEKRRSSLDRALQASVEELQLLHAEWTDEGRYYEGRWSIFHFAVSSARADITSMLFRRFHLYASSGTLQQQQQSRKYQYPSPTQLALLACFYDHPQAIMAVMLYASSYSKAASAAAAVSGATRAITQLYLGEFLNNEGSFPQALSLSAMSSEENKRGEADEDANANDADEDALFAKIAKVTPLEVAVHYGSRAALKYLCEVGVRIPFQHLVKATLSGSVNEGNLVHLYTAYFAANKDLRNAEAVDIAPFSAPNADGAQSAALMRRALSGMFVAPEMARQRTLINAPLPPSIVSLAGKKSAGVAVASGAVSGKATVHGGETLLHLCARRGHSALASLLLEYGANARIRDNRGFTPLQTSVSFGSSTVTNVLASEQPRLARAVKYLSVCVRAHLLRKARMQASEEMAASLPRESIAAGVTLESLPFSTAAAAANFGAQTQMEYEADSDISSALVPATRAYEPSLNSEEDQGGPGRDYEPSTSS